jgi:hypothetical protein
VEYPSGGVGEPGVIDYIVNVKGFASAEAGRSRSKLLVFILVFNAFNCSIAFVSHHYT